MTWLTERGSIETFVPDQGPVVDQYAPLGPVVMARYASLTYARGLRERLSAAGQLVADVRRFRAAFRRREPDLVVVVTTTVPAALIAARLEGIPTIVYAAEIYAQGWKGAAFLRAWGAVLAHATAWLADGLVSCSNMVERQFPARRGQPRGVAYPKIGPEYATGDRERGRARYGLETAAPCLAVVGALSRARGQDLALRALALVRRRHPDARLLIVGAPNPRAVDIAFADGLRALARDLGVAEAVVFAGTTDEMADVYAAADIVLNPARFAEPFGRVAPEALVAGRAVVATRVGAMEEVIADGVDGLLVAPEDPEALADAVNRLWEDAQLRDELVAAGGEHVRARFGGKEELEVWQRVISDVARGARG